MIVILMEYHGLDLQGAVDYVGDLCAQTIDTFNENKTNVPSWGPEIDDMVSRYIQGLQDWIVGLVNIFDSCSHRIDFVVLLDPYIGAFKRTDTLERKAWK